MCEYCGNSVLEVNSVHRFDPTHTLTLRNAFVADMNRRFKHIAKLINKAVVENDVFGLAVPKINVLQNIPSKSAFSFATKDAKIALFLQWLRTVEDAVILEMLPNGSSIGGIQQDTWINLYLAQAFKQGTKRAMQELKKYGLGITLENSTDVFINPIRLEKLRVLFTRAFTDLRGITNTMDEQISRILAQGLFEGQAPATLARMINSAIIGNGEMLGIDITYINKNGNQVSYFMSGQRRAEILARTEIIRAHHVATITEYRNWEVEGVYVLAEWATAKDGRVCDECASMEGTLWSLDEIEPMIPLHPQCRCVTIPFIDTTKTKVDSYDNV